MSKTRTNNYYEVYAVRASTKAQIQIGETIAVILIFLVLLTFGLLWFQSQQQANVSIQQDEQTRQDLVAQAKAIINLPELGCGSIDSSGNGCMDVYRLRSLQRALQDETSPLYQRYEQQFLGFTLEVENAYPITRGIAAPPTVFDFSPEAISGGDVRTTSSSARSLPIALYDPIAETYNLGFITITQHRGDVEAVP